jgi:hypothetical protein
MCTCSVTSESQPTITIEETCWGKLPLEAFSTSGRAVGFGSRAASAKRGKPCNGDLTVTLILLMLCGFCVQEQPNQTVLAFGAESADG